MAYNADRNGEHIFPTIATIARRSGYKPRQVHNVIAGIKAKGILIPTARISRAHGFVTEYRMNLSGVPLLPELETQQRLHTTTEASAQTSHSSAFPSLQFAGSSLQCATPKPALAIAEKQYEQNYKYPGIEPSRRTQISPDFMVKDEHRTLARELGIDADAECPAFVDHYQAIGATRSDWNAAFKSWLRKSIKFGANDKFSRSRGNAALGMDRDAKPERASEPSIPMPEDLDRDAGRRAWDAVRETLKPPVINAHTFETWFKPSKGWGVSKDTLYVFTPTEDHERSVAKHEKLKKRGLMDLRDSAQMMRNSLGPFDNSHLIDATRAVEEFLAELDYRQERAEVDADMMSEYRKMLAILGLTLEQEIMPRLSALADKLISAATASGVRAACEPRRMLETDGTVVREIPARFQLPPCYEQNILAAGVGAVTDAVKSAAKRVGRK